MDAKIVMTAFSMLFLAEMGDKTQLAVLTLSASSGRPASVFIGATLAPIAVTALGAFVGAAAGKFISPVLLNRVAATSFIARGAPGPEIHSEVRKLEAGEIDRYCRP